MSRAQRRKFYADPKLRRHVAEMEKATPKGAKLPGHVGDTKKGARMMGEWKQMKGKMPPFAKKKAAKMPAFGVKDSARAAVLASMASHGKAGN